MVFSNKVVLITGASAGIGKASARAFAKAGARVIINGASDKGAAVAAEIERAGGSAHFAQGDVADVDVCRALVATAVELYGRLDILVNNAGIVPVGDVTGFDEDGFDRAVDINVKSVFFLSQAAVRQMRKQGGGVIVNTGSIAGLIGPKNRALYSLTKGALISLTRAMAADHAREGIRVNCVCPGMVMSPSLQARIDDTPDPQKTLEAFGDGIPLGRIGDADEIAQMILLAASDEAGFMTGSILTIDGGASL